MNTTTSAFILRSEKNIFISGSSRLLINDAYEVYMINKVEHILTRLQTIIKFKEVIYDDWGSSTLLLSVDNYIYVLDSDNVLEPARNFNRQVISTSPTHVITTANELYEYRFSNGLKFYYKWSYDAPVAKVIRGFLGDHNGVLFRNGTLLMWGANKGMSFNMH